MIGKLQKIIDESDPFLMEPYHGKNSDQLYEIIVRLQQELTAIERMKSLTWIETQKITLRSVNALYQLRLIIEDKVDGGHAIV